MEIWVGIYIISDGEHSMEDTAEEKWKKGTASSEVFQFLNPKDKDDGQSWCY